MLAPLQNRNRLALMSRRLGIYKIPDGPSDGYAAAATWNAGVATSGSQNATNIAIGRNTATNYNRAGFRFCPTVGGGAHVAWAKIRMNCYMAWSGGNPKVRITAEPVDNAGSFPTWQEIWTRARGADEVFWIPGAWLVDKWYETPDLAPVLQPVFNRLGWAPGNGLVVWIDATAETGSSGWRILRSWEQAPHGAVSAQLLVQF